MTDTQTLPEQTEAKPKSRTIRYTIAVLAGVLVGGLITGTVMDNQAKAEAEKVTATANAQVAAAEQRADDAIAWSESAIDQRETAVSEGEAKLDDREAALDEREAAVTKTEEKIDASQIEPGTYLVPDELTAGRYRTTENISYCYMKQQKNGNTIDNMLEMSGRPVFTVQNIAGSELIIDEACGTVEKI